MLCRNGLLVAAQALLVLSLIASTCVFQVIVGHGEPAPRLCNKDPFALKSLTYLSRIFPKAKFVLMLRDGRATVHSMISRKVQRILIQTHKDLCRNASQSFDVFILGAVWGGFLSVLIGLLLAPFTGDHLWF